MSRERRGNYFLVVIFILGVVVSAALFWSIESWSRERVTAERAQRAMSWGNRLGRELESDASKLSSVGGVVSGMKTVDRELIQTLVRSLVRDDTIRSVAWAPEVTSGSLFSFFDSYPEQSFQEAKFKSILPVAGRLFPIAVVEGATDRLRPNSELSQDAEWSEALNEALADANLHPIVFQASDATSTSIIMLLQLIKGDGTSVGVLMMEVAFQDLLHETKEENTDNDLTLQIWDSFPITASSQRLYSLEDRQSAVEPLATVPLPIGKSRWAVSFYPTGEPQPFSWEAVLAGLFGLASTLFMVSYCRYLFGRETQSQFLIEESNKVLREKEKAYRDTINQLKRSEERYADLFDKSQALIWTQELDGTISSLNPAAANSLGYRPDEMKGRPLKDFILPTERHTFGTFLDRAKSENSRGLLKLYTKNGATRFWMYQTSLSRDEKEETVRCHALDVTESQQAERELERLSRRNELILESVGEGVYGINLAGECTFVNPAALRFTEHSREELMSAARTMHEILQPYRPDGSDYPWEESASYQTLNDGEIRRVTGELMVRKDSSPFPVDYVVTPIVEDDDRILGAVVTFQDVTERRAVEQMKNEFISIVSHELRTPLTSIRGSLGLLASGLLLKFPDKADKMLKIAVENTDRLVRLINDILDIERLESGKVTVELAELELGDLMRSASDTMQSMANTNNVKLDTKPLKQKVWADSDRILQVLTNLLSNAIKFSGDGQSVKLRAKVLKGSESGWVRVTVQDTGRGIPEDKLDKIFERFGQVDASDSREKGGTGLGLPICRTIVQQHGGRLWVESVLGEGSKFHFTLPQEPPANQSTEESSSPS